MHSMCELRPLPSPALPRRQTILAVAILFAAAVLGADEPQRKLETMTIPQASAQPDVSRLPEFFSSDPDYDAFVNEYFQRHLSVDERGIYLGGGPVLLAVDHLWVIENDMYLFPWIDRGAMGLERQGGRPDDHILNTLLHLPVDKFGYAWGGRLRTEPNNAVHHWIPMFGWPWPKHERNFTVERPVGWNFNDVADGQRSLWTTRDIELEPGYPDHCLVGRITGPRPELLSPPFEVDVYQAPIIELDIRYDAPQPQAADRLVDGLRLAWTSTDSPEFSAECEVRSRYSDLPPQDYPEHYTSLAGPGSTRYPLYFPMCQHPQWGRAGRRITRLKLIPTTTAPEGTRISLNYLRLTYDTRLSTSNTTLINAAWRAFAWSGDDEFLTAMLPKLRRAMTFLNVHLRGKQDGLLNQGWFVGRDAVENDTAGHSVPCSYWDLMPGGRHDLDACVGYYQALRSMARLERAAQARGIPVEPVEILAPDGLATVNWDDTPDQLQTHAEHVKTRIEQVFWCPDTQRFARTIDRDGRQKDYGFLHANLLALFEGVGTRAQRDAILEWLDGRVIEGDTATGPDIYRWRFAPRSTTRRNESFYYWAWIWERQRDPDNPIFAWGNQMQDGGAIPMTSLLELDARAQTHRREQIDRAFQRTLEVRDWFHDVKAAGGRGRDFYRAYYDGHPASGMQQSPTPGGLGLDREFLSDAALGTAFVPLVFLGIEAPEDGVLAITPAVPSALEHVGMRNLYYRGNHISVTAGQHYVSLVGSRLPHAEGLQARVTLHEAPCPARVLVNGQDHADFQQTDSGTVVVTLPLASVRIEVLPR